MFAIEAAGEEGDAALQKMLSAYGLRDQDHYQQVSDTFQRHFSSNSSFTQAAVNARMEQSKQQMQAAVDPAALEPIAGVSLEAYGKISAQRMSVTTPAQLAQLLARFGIDEAAFARADQGWQARMSQQDNPMAAVAIATEYAKYFAGSGAGQFGGAAQAAAGGIGLDGRVGQAPSGSEPCSFDRYVEIMTAQSCWSDQGRDVNSMLKQVFQMNAVDWGQLSAYWSQRIGADYTLAMQMDSLMNTYRARYGGGGGADDDLTV